MASVKGTRYYGTAYQSGTAAPALPQIPDKELRRERQEQIRKARQDVEARVLEKRHERREFSRVQILVLTAAMAVLIASVSLFIVRVSVKESTRNAIESLEREIQTVHHENVILKNRRNAGIDYDRVYTIATEELGMTSPMKQQVVYYEQPDLEFVHKYGDIPK